MIVADLVNTPVDIARTLQKYDGQAEVREMERLLIDAIAAVQETIYIENQ